MIKNRTVQLVFQTVYCVLAVIGFLDSLGYFNANFNNNFYVYYTNLSNYLCMGFMFVILSKTIKNANKKEDGLCDTAPLFNFLSVIIILVTFLVYNFLLAKENSVVHYFTSLSNLIMHLILPAMFILNRVLFYKHNTIKWYHPFLCPIIPLIYVAFILIRAQILKGSSDAVLYPYFFLNVDNLGWSGLFTWLAILICVFILLAYLLFALDNLKTIKEKIKSKKINR